MTATFSSSSVSYDAPDFFAPSGVPVVKYTREGWDTRVKGKDDNHRLNFNDGRDKKKELDAMLFDSSCSLYSGTADEIAPRPQTQRWNLLTNQLKDTASPVAKKEVCFRHSAEHRAAQGFNSTQRHAPDNCKSLLMEKRKRHQAHGSAMVRNPRIYAKIADYGSGAHELDAHVLARSFLCDTHNVRSFILRINPFTHGAACIDQIQVRCRAAETHLAYR
jgi:hypothetical protein